MIQNNLPTFKIISSFYKNHIFNSFFNERIYFDFYLILHNFIIEKKSFSFYFIVPNILFSKIKIFYFNISKINYK